MHAFVEWSLIKRIGSPVDKLLHIAHLGEQPVIGRADQRGALLEFLQLRQAFVRQVKYPPTGIVVIVSMLYETQADKLGYLLHHKLVRMSQFPRQIRRRCRTKLCKNSDQGTGSNRDDDPHPVEDHFGLFGNQDAQPLDGTAKKHDVIDRDRVVLPLSQGACTSE